MIEQDEGFANREERIFSSNAIKVNVKRSLATSERCQRGPFSCIKKGSPGNGVLVVQPGLRGECARLPSTTVSRERLISIVKEGAVRPPLPRRRISVGRPAVSTN